MRFVTGLTMLLVHTKMCVPPRSESGHEHGPCSPARSGHYASSHRELRLPPNNRSSFFVLRLSDSTNQVQHDLHAVAVVSPTCLLA